MARCREELFELRELAVGGPLWVARSLRARTLGLAWLDRPPAGAALMIPRCRSVHTFGMRFPLDLVFVDADGWVVRVDRDVPPRRVRACRRARAVLEVARAASAVESVAGTIHMAMRKTTVYLHEDEAEGLRQLSASTGRSQAELMRDAVRRLISRRPAREFRSMGLGEGDGSPARRWDADELYARRVRSPSEPR